VQSPARVPLHPGGKRGHLATWHEGLAVGDPEIDGQHRELFAQADRLSAAMRSGDSSAEVPAQIDALVEYCRDHFRREEALMQALAYPFQSLHKGGHRTFERQLKAIQEKSALKGSTALLALQLSALMRGWLIDHIGTEDLKLAAFARQSAGESGARGARGAVARVGAGDGRNRLKEPSSVARATTALTRMQAEVQKTSWRREEVAARGGARARGSPASDFYEGTELKRLAAQAGVSTEVLHRVMLALRHYDLA
jgi:hemerythrin